MPKLEDVLKDALVLDAQSRAALADELLCSLDGDPLGEAEIERLWVDAARQRLVAYREGRTTLVPAEQVHVKAEKLLQ
jgi:hypothetical protein